jgi:hypothetical protein
MPRSRRQRNRRRPGGFTPRGLDAPHRLLMPGLAGPARRAYFNDLAGGMVAVFGLAVAALAFCWLGPLGAIAGLGAGLLAGGWAAVKGRFYRR